MTRRIGSGTRQFAVTLEDAAIELDGKPLAADLRLLPPDRCSLLVGGRSYTFNLARDPAQPGQLLLTYRGRTLALADARRHGARGARPDSGRQRLLAPMAGRIVRALAAAGDTVAQGQGLLVLEAMKMQNEVRAPKAGRLLTLNATPGAAVSPGDLLAEID